MKTLILALALSTVALTGCDYFGSAEQKAFAEFVAKCKADPSTADCKAWEESKKP